MGVPVGTFLALVLSRTDMPRRRPVFWLVASLLFLPLYLHAAAWDAGFGQLGWYSAGARRRCRRRCCRELWAVMWIHGLWSVPWVTLIVSAALRWSEPELEEAALLDATYAAGVLRTSHCGEPGRVSSAASVWVLLVAISEIVVTDLYQVRTLAEELYTGYALANDPATTFGGCTARLSDRSADRCGHDGAGPAGWSSRTMCRGARRWCFAWAAGGGR